ncbi:hypothetical protein AX15_000457 [Amanita polypyramis BW_CC]|nr:hypothetical protein AX15_000457 [Amanita polypyramis BW_CC]
MPSLFITNFVRTPTASTTSSPPTISDSGWSSSASEYAIGKERLKPELDQRREQQKEQKTGVRPLLVPATPPTIPAMPALTKGGSYTSLPLDVYLSTSKPQSQAYERPPARTHPTLVPPRPNAAPSQSINQAHHPTPIPLPKPSTSTSRPISIVNVVRTCTTPACSNLIPPWSSPCIRRCTNCVKSDWDARKADVERCVREVRKARGTCTAYAHAPTYPRTQTTTRIHTRTEPAKLQINYSISHFPMAQRQIVPVLLQRALHEAARR